ncbi:MAG: sugar transferase [Chloroflexi bacterium]|nr:sugar transferase [Chloroflexota bacterium]MBI3339394.1 sugar transferase [Chloroflexota bacterium]
MQNEAPLDIIRRYDPNALRLVAQNRNGYYVAKRILDSLIALVLLLLLSPLLLLISILIVIYSPGPVFFTQERVGAKRETHGRHTYWKKATFPCYKFRTMHVNADSSIHQAYVAALIKNDEEQMTALQGAPTQPRKLVNDLRIIRPGKLLRKFSLDELPQLWNVLRGEMSLVGPRPAIPYEVEMYKPWHLQRLEAQPGITGLQQVKTRSAADFDQQVRLDIQYIQNQSLWLDIKIMFETPFVIISAKGAY